MYEDFYGLKEKPFSVAPDSSFLYLSDKHRRALSALEYSIVNKSSFAVITGEIGSGKTTLVRELMNKIEGEVEIGLVSNVNIASFEELMQWILYAFELEYTNKEKVELFDAFTEYLIENYSRGRRTVLIIDEAQNLSPQILEQLRMLSNINAEKHQVLQLILVGQPGLRDILHQPELLQFVQRVEIDFFLEPLNLDETTLYIQHRLSVSGGDKNIFAPDTYQIIWHSTGGIPRLINILCDMALVYGFADQKKLIDINIIKHVLKDKKGGLSPVVEDKPKLMEKTQEHEQKRAAAKPVSLNESSVKQGKQDRRKKGLSSLEKLFKKNGQ